MNPNGGIPHRLGNMEGLSDNMKEQTVIHIFFLHMVFIK